MTHTDVLPVCILHVHCMYTRVVCIYIHYMRKSYMWPHIIYIILYEVYDVATSAQLYPYAYNIYI
jgi:hypothetical protein